MGLSLCAGLIKGTFRTNYKWQTINYKGIARQSDVLPENFEFTDGFQILSVGSWQRIASTTTFNEEYPLLFRSTIQITGKMPGNNPSETYNLRFLTAGQNFSYEDTIDQAYEQSILEEEEVKDEVQITDPEQEGCFICDDPHIFIKALINIAYNVGEKKAKQLIKETKSFSSEVSLKIADCVKEGEELYIIGKFPKYRKPEGFYNRVLKLMGGLNVYNYSSNMDLYNQKIPYEGEVYLQENKKDFHISCVSISPSDKKTFSSGERNVLTFYNNKNTIIARIFFQSKKDLLLIWDTYYTKIRKSSGESYLIRYDEEHNTNYHDTLKHRL